MVELAHVYVQDEKLISCAVTFNHLYKRLLQFSTEDSRSFEYILCWHIGYSALKLNAFPSLFCHIQKSQLNVKSSLLFMETKRGVTELLLLLELK